MACTKSSLKDNVEALNHGKNTDDSMKNDDEEAAHENVTLVYMLFMITLSNIMTYFLRSFFR